MYDYKFTHPSLSKASQILYLFGVPYERTRHSRLFCPNTQDVDNTTKGLLIHVDDCLGVDLVQFLLRSNILLEQKRLEQLKGNTGIFAGDVIAFCLCGEINGVCLILYSN